MRPYEARRALLMTMFDRPSERGEEQHPVRLSATDLEILLVCWINEFVYLVQSVGFVPVSTQILIREADTVEASSSRRTSPARCWI
ncbi:MAG: archease [Rubrobacter sp.]|nr:archease [Rubrobacter sp.]